MHAFDRLPPHFRWTPGQLADAVPLRLSELFAFSATGDGSGDDAPAPANSPRRRAHPASGYLPAEALATRFRIS